MNNLTGSLGTSKLLQRPDFVAIEPGSYVAALPKSKGGNAAARYGGDGAGLPMLVVYARFIAWAIEQTHFPFPEQVIDRFRCNKATANRWLNCLAEAYGVDRPRRSRYGVRKHT